MSAQFNWNIRVLFQRTSKQLSPLSLNNLEGSFLSAHPLKRDLIKGSVLESGLPYYLHWNALKPARFHCIPIGILCASKQTIDVPIPGMVFWGGFCHVYRIFRSPISHFLNHCESMEIFWRAGAWVLTLHQIIHQIHFIIKFLSDMWHLLLYKKSWYPRKVPQLYLQ